MYVCLYVCMYIFRELNVHSCFQCKLNVYRVLRCSGPLVDRHCLSTSMFEAYSDQNVVSDKVARWTVVFGVFSH